MAEETIQDPLSPSPPRTFTVVGTLVGVALVASYLFAYALTNALVAADVVSRWQPGHDPRPARMCIGFVGMMVVFTIIAGVAQWMSRRQLKRIDEMEEED